MAEEGRVEGRVEPAAEGGRGHPGLAQQETGLQAVPRGAQDEGASVARGSVADQMDVAVEPHASARKEQEAGRGDQGRTQGPEE